MIRKGRMSLSEDGRDVIKKLEKMRKDMQNRLYAVQLTYNVKSTDVYVAPIELFTEYKIETGYIWKIRKYYKGDYLFGMLNLTA